MSIRFSAAVVIAMLGAGSANAAPITWNLTSGSCSTTGSGSDGNTRTCASTPAGGPSVTASGWANTTNSTNVLIQDALMEVFSGGLGVRNRDRTSGDTGETSSPQHAVDNINRYDSLRFDFTSAVRLTQLNIGWMGSDSDITVLAYTGAGVAPLAGLAYASLIGSGWTLVNHYSNPGVGSENINAGGISSRYWLIGAFNPTVGSAPTWADSTGDAVKLLTLTGEATVPEPASLGLFGFGLVALAARLRRARR